MGAGCLNCLCITFGTLSFVFILLHFKFDSLLEVAIRSQLVVAEGNDLYRQWSDIPIGMVAYKYRFFEISNPEEALRGEKVKVRERGPYCFKHRRYKRITGWSVNKEIVKYFEYKVNYFDQECSGSNSLDDEFFMVNPLFAALAQTISDMIEKQLPLAPVTSPVAYALVNSLLDSHGMTLFMKKSVRDILYGFKVNLLETMETFTAPLKNLGITLAALPPSPPGNMFGLLYGKNDTPEGEYEMYTGQGSTSEIMGYFASFKGRNTQSFWKGDHCNRIEGGDGTLFPPFVTPTTRMVAFAVDLCRSIEFAYMGPGEYMGIKGYKFGLPKSAFATPEQNPQNECFCLFTGKKRQDRCSISGTYDLGGCQAGAPLIISSPHFLDTEPDLAKQVDGLNPNINDHETFVILEPITSAGIFGLKRLQFSLRVERVPYLRNMQGIRSGVIPFVWAEEGGGLTTELADQMKGMLLTPLWWITRIITVCAIVFPFIFALCMMLRLTRGPDSKQKVTPINSPVKPRHLPNTVKRVSTSIPPPPPPPLPPPPPPTGLATPNGYPAMSGTNGMMNPNYNLMGAAPMYPSGLAVMASNGMVYGVPVMNGPGSRSSSRASSRASHASRASIAMSEFASAHADKILARGTSLPAPTLLQQVNEEAERESVISDEINGNDDDPSQDVASLEIQRALRSEERAMQKMLRNLESDYKV